MYQAPLQNLGKLRLFGIGSCQPPLRREPTRALGQRSSWRRALPLLLASFAFFGGVACSAQSLVLDSFNAGATAGSVRAGSSWVGNVTQNATSITVGGTATDVNGWGATGLSLNASSMAFIAITGQRDSGHAATRFSIQLEDRNLNTQVLSVSATAFSAGALTLVQIAIPRWNSGFDAAHITGWSIGGGGLGLAAFRMTFDQLAFTATTSPGVPIAPVVTGSFGASTRAIGETITFTVNATGTAPLTYQWFKNSTIAVANTATATTAALTLANLTALDSGTYTCTITNAAGSVGSDAFALTVTPAPAAVGAPVINSAVADVATTTGAYTYQISATNTPTSYAASGLPVGLSLNPTTGTITGTATVPGVYAVDLTASNATGASGAFTLTLTVRALPIISSSATVSGSVGRTFSYAIAASNTPTSFNVGALPAGLVVNPSTGAISGTPTTAGITTVTLSATNATGTGATATLVITINAISAGGGGGGGGGGSGGGGGTVPTGSAPVILSQPVGQNAAEGAGVTFTVGASGTDLNYQWSRNGVVLTGAVFSTISLNNVRGGDAGTYTVLVSNSAGAVTSVGAALTIVGLPSSPTITTQPVASTVTAGGSAGFSVVASGASPLTYQWLKDGAVIGGATAATLNLSGVTVASAGRYSVVVTSSGGSVTSSAGVLSVSAPSIAGTYFGSFAGNGGSFGLRLGSDRTGVFLGFATAARVALVSLDVVVDAGGRFSVTQRSGSAVTPATNPPTAAANADITISGAIAADGTVSGVVPALNLTFSAPTGTSAGSTSAVAGYYQSGVAGGSGQSLALVGPAGEALVVTLSGPSADGGRGTVTAAGAITVTTAGNAAITASISVAAGTIATTATTAAGATITYGGTGSIGGEKLINISTRSLTGTAADTLIVGFVITGTEPKPVLVRAIGPTLSTFNVDGALSAVRLEVFRGPVSMVVGTDWGAPANNPTDVAATAARVGAFALPANSRDAAVLLNLPPGNYTAVVTGQGGVSGVALVEVYDATVGVIPTAQRVVNIATRATAGTGDNTLIAGFYVSGTVPKRVLIRGVGPSLAQFGVTGVLARPQLSVAAGATELAQNAGVATSTDLAGIVAASAQVGAFALVANSQDAAILINLAPGAYTARVSGVGATTGAALIEVYEVP